MAVQIPFPLPAVGFALNSKVRVNLDFLVAQFNEFNSGTATWDNVSIGTANSLTGTLTFYNASNANYLTFKAGVTSASTTFTLPVSAPASDGLLKSTSAGVMSWLTGTGILYNSSSSYGFSGVASVANALAKVSTAGVVSLADHSYNVTAVDNGLLYIASGSAVAALTNTLGSTGILIGASSGTPKFVSLLGTTNQIVVTINSNDITLTTPQNLNTSADFQVNSLRTAAGSTSSCALRLNAANTGIYMPSATEMDFVIGGVAYAALDTSGNFFATTGEIRGNDIRALRHLKVSGSSAGTVTIDARTSFTNYTLTLPSDDGNANDVLSSDGSGNLSWVSVSSAGGATKALDNLASVAINTSLLPGSDNAIDFGSSSKNARSLYFSTSLKNGSTTLATATEVGYLTGVTSAIQTQIAGLSPIAGSSSIVTVGTVTSGTWSATTVAVNKGGTGQTSYTDGQLLIGNTTGNTLAKATLTGTSNQVVVTNGSGTITLSTPQSIGTGSTPSFTGLTLTDNLVFNPTTKGVKGTTTNDSGAAGVIGEYIESNVTSDTSFPTSGQYGDGTSVALTAGDWDLTVLFYINGNSSDLSVVLIGISTTIGNDATGLTPPINNLRWQASIGTVVVPITIPNYRLSLSGSSTAYAKIQGTYTTGTPQYRVALRARRRR